MKVAINTKTELVLLVYGFCIHCLQSELNYLKERRKVLTERKAAATRLDGNKFLGRKNKPL